MALENLLCVSVLCVSVSAYAERGLWTVFLLIIVSISICSLASREMISTLCYFIIWPLDEKTATALLRSDLRLAFTMLLSILHIKLGFLPLAIVLYSFVHFIVGKD
jgi:hypothetical protein